MVLASGKSWAKKALRRYSEGDGGILRFKWIDVDLYSMTGSLCAHNV
jgi:hypothetical protein